MQADGAKVESVVAASAVAHVRAVPVETTAAYQVLRVNDDLVKLAVVELTKSKEAAPVVVIVPVTPTVDPVVAIDVAVELYAVADEAMYPLQVTVAAVWAVITVSAVLAAVHEQRMYQSVVALAVAAVAPVASQIWKLLDPAVAVRPIIVVGVQTRA